MEELFKLKWCFFPKVCCVRPSTVNRWLNDYRENDIINNNYHEVKSKSTVINDPKCGNRPTANRRVIDGSDAGFGTFPWQALVQIGKAKCGGVLGSYLDSNFNITFF